MRRPPAITAPLPLLALGLLAGCGSSSSDSSTATTAATARPTSSRHTPRGSSPWRPTSRPTRPTSRTTTRPTARASRAPWPTRSPISSASSPGQLGDRAVQLLLRAWPEGLRLRRQPDLDHARARAARRLLLPYYTAQPGGGRLEELLRGERHLARRPQGREIGVQIGTTSLDAVNDQIQPSASRRSSTTPTTSSPRSRRARSTRSWSTCPRPST